ncbi:ROK family protein [uncultured Jatrophihabitans sp.]|uniref:ROK family transcriptional regulator n=1 Tax=uncultured Jatrophihabitans sp. TaxID=1610747 RepID=UPI0035CC3318
MSQSSAAVRPEAIRRHNLSLILGHIHRDGALTRAALTQRLGVSRSTIGALVAELTQLGIVEEVVPSGGAGVGRPSHVVAPHKRGPYAVAVDVDVAHVTVAAVGLGGEVLARRVVITEVPASAEAVAALVAEAMPIVQAEACPDARPAGIGASVPGTVDRRTGHVGVAPNLGWHDAPFGALLADLAPPGMPIAIGNDADLAALAEHQRGSARGIDDVVYVMGRIGVGAGILIGGVPLLGRDGHAGEIGHNVLDPTGPECHCGKRGCVEVYVGGAALLERAGRPLPPNDEAVAAVIADAHRGDARALAAVCGIAEPLGRTIAALLNTLNPQLVLLGGSFAEVLRLAHRELEDSLERYALEAPNRTVQLLEPALGADSALLGAAEIAFTALLEDPVGATALVG